MGCQRVLAPLHEHSRHVKRLEVWGGAAGSRVAAEAHLPRQVAERVGGRGVPQGPGLLQKHICRFKWLNVWVWEEGCRGRC